ncbi:hypothetical protein SDC9_178648 [bioreactor metagenome]|uniref:Uncharacterized protein n=1 Tax=bioreactor metagenome TaxID=1076179 RepID=A0A645H4B5_9ZZZZ
MCKSGNAAKVHHRGRALDGVHHTKNFVDVVAAEVFGFFRFKKDLIQLVKQGRGFINKHFEHGLHAGVNCHIAHLLFFYIFGRPEKLLLKEVFVTLGRN